MSTTGASDRTKNTNLENVFEVSCGKPFHFGGVIGKFANDAVTERRDKAKSVREVINFTSTKET